ncbi:MAG: hypothetical protein K2N63_10670 [Lachnospiraceae bacterium]|nr:hypothetical protein [Lachnospiraceae bacterium]
MGEYSLNTDFSSLQEPQAGEWILHFSKLAEEAFEDVDSRRRVLANLLVLERFINTLRQGLAANKAKISKGLEEARRLLWDYLNGYVEPDAFQDFANNYYACLYALNVGDVDIDAPKEFYTEYFGDSNLESYERIAIEYSSILLIELVSLAGGRIDFDDFKDCTKIDFYVVDNIIHLLKDACIELTHTPRPSSSASNQPKAEQQLHCTPLFRELIKHIQDDLQLALTDNMVDLFALKQAYTHHTILPQEYAQKLLEY